VNNVSDNLAKQVVDSLRATPFVLALLVLNVISLAGFAFILVEVSQAMERREAIIARCLDRS
jgi:hypothetical protein